MITTQVVRGICRKLGSAASRAEMEGVALMIEAMLRGRWIDAHAADGVDHRRGSLWLAGFLH